MSCLHVYKPGETLGLSFSVETLNEVIADLRVQAIRDRKLRDLIQHARLDPRIGDSPGSRNPSTEKHEIVNQAIHDASRSRTRAVTFDQESLDLAGNE